MADHLEDNHPCPRQPQTGAAAQPLLAGSTEISAGISNPSRPAGLSLDAPALIEAVLKRWKWLLAGGALLAGALFALGLRAMDSDYSARVQLVRCEPPSTSDSFKPRSLPIQTLAGMLQNTELLLRVAPQARPPMSPHQLARGVKVAPERNSDLLTVTVPGATPDAAVELANLYARTAVEFSQKLQARDAAEERNLLKGQLDRLESDLAALNEELRSLPHASLRLGERYQSLSTNLEAARVELANFKPLFNEDQRREKQLKKVTALERQQYAINQIKAAEESRLLVSARHRAAQLVAQNPPGYYRLFAPAKRSDVRAHHPRLKSAALSIFGAMVGVIATAGLVALRELFDDSVKTANDAAGISQLPVLATLGNLRQLKPAAQTAWSIRAWSAVQPLLIPLPGGALVCGIISSHPGEGRSTWMGLLARAASQRGFRVLSVATHSIPGDFENEAEVGENGGDGTTPHPNVLASSSQVTERLIGPDPQALLHISLPRWSWTFKRRQQWQAALEHWSQIENLVILVELPPVSVSESLLLAETVPNLFWLVDAGATTAAELREHLDQFRQARCNLVGVGLNHESPPPRPIRFFQPAPATAGALG